LFLRLESLNYLVFKTG